MAWHNPIGTATPPLQVLVSVGGGMTIRISRDELASWAGGAADDFGTDAWSWMGAATPPRGGERQGQGQGTRKRKRR